jgi:hypothetical protein
MSEPAIQLEGTDDRTQVPQEILKALIYTHNRSNANTSEVHLACSSLQAVIEMLLERGLIDREELSKRQHAAAETLRRQYMQRGMGVAVQEFGVSKYQFSAGAKVDCQNRIHLCHAACCKLPLALSKEDIQEGKIVWELDQPYMLAHDEDGYCTHMDRGEHTCGVYEHRPIPCRGYDCSQDPRIWLDFENYQINPQINEPDWPASLPGEPGDG